MLHYLMLRSEYAYESSIIYDFASSSGFASAAASDDVFGFIVATYINTAPMTETIPLPVLILCR